jgi:hypothetical protein
MKTSIGLVAVLLVGALSGCQSMNISPTVPPAAIVPAAKVVALSATQIAAVKSGVKDSLKGTAATFDKPFIAASDASGTLNVCGYAKSKKLPAPAGDKPFIGSFAKDKFIVSQIGGSDVQSKAVADACRQKGIDLGA